MIFHIARQNRTVIGCQCSTEWWSRCQDWCRCWNSASIQLHFIWQRHPPGIWLAHKGEQCYRPISSELLHCSHFWVLVPVCLLVLLNSWFYCFIRHPKLKSFLFLLALWQAVRRWNTFCREGRGVIYSFLWQGWCRRSVWRRFWIRWRSKGTLMLTRTSVVVYIFLLIGKYVQERMPSL